jgi:hypothetical protein
MSNFSGQHLVTKFDSAKSQPLTNQRLAKCRYKTTKAQKAKYPSICVSVPFLADSDIIDAVPQLVSHIRAMLENAQDGVLRSLYESAQGSLSAVSDSDISIAACIGYLEAESSGSRLTKEFVESWFDGAANDYMVAIIGEKLGYRDELTPEQEATIGKHVKGYKDLFSSLAGGKTMLQENQIKSLMKVLELIDTDDTGTKLHARLTGMLNKPKMEDLLDLSML